MGAADETGLTIKEYLARIDQKVDKIDEKLDGKAEMNYVQSLEGRLRTLESTGSAHAQAALGEVERLKEQHARELGELWASINWLKKKVWLAAGATGAVAGLWSVVHTNLVHW